MDAALRPVGATTHRVRFENPAISQQNIVSISKQNSTKPLRSVCEKVRRCPKLKTKPPLRTTYRNCEAEPDMVASLTIWLNYTSDDLAVLRSSNLPEITIIKKNRVTSRFLLSIALCVYRHRDSVPQPNAYFKTGITRAPQYNRETWPSAKYIPKL